MYSVDYEKSPTTGQMLELQKLGVVMAKEQKKLKNSLRNDNARVFLTGEVECLEVDGSSGFRYSTHHYAGKVARIGYRAWSMRLVEAFWLRDLDNDFTDGFRASYVFNWTDMGVVKAIRSVHTRKFGEPENYNAEAPADALDRLEHWSGFWRGIQAFETVSQADCDRLIENVRNFGEVSRVIAEI